MAFTKSYAIAAKPAPVFELLTSPLHLQTWLAEHAEAGTQPGEPFRFWGKHTLWTPAAGDAKQTLAKFEFPNALAFAWPWRGAASDATVKIAAAGEGSRVDITHAFSTPWSAGDPELGAARAARQDRIAAAFWDVAIANLAYYAFEGEALLLPDYPAAASSNALELSLVIEAPPTDVFAALTSAKQLDRWIGDPAQVEPKKGGAYRYGWTGPDGAPLGPTQILELAPGERLVHDWTWPDEPPSRVSWEIEEEGPYARVKLVHARGAAPYPAPDALLWCRALIALRDLVAAK